MKNVFQLMGALCLLTVVALAQVPRPGDREYMAQGNLVVVRVIPANGTAKLFLAGHEAAGLDVKNPIKLLSIKLASDGRKETLRYTGQDNEYLVQGVPSAKSYELQIRAEVRGKKEDVQISIPQTKP